MTQVVHHSPAKYKVGDLVNVSIRYPIGHYRVPMYMRGNASMEAVINIAPVIPPPSQE